MLKEFFPYFDKKIIIFLYIVLLSEYFIDYFIKFDIKYILHDMITFI